MSPVPGTFRGLVVERTHRITLDGEPEAVFALFGPLREAEWAAGWEPELLAYSAGVPEPGWVFRTYDADRGETVWLLALLESEQRHIEYVRTTPKSDLAQIRITVSEVEGGRSSAEITYRLTGLSDAGNRYVGSFTEAHYRDLIDEWATAINHYLATGEALATSL